MFNDLDKREILERAAAYVVAAFCTLIFLGLLFYCLKSTYMIAPNEIPVETKDSILRNLFILLGVLLVTGFAGVLDNKLSVKAVKFIKIAFGAVITAAVLWMCLWWVFAADRIPDGDQAFVYGASSYFLEGNYAFLQKGGYLHMYPTQKCLVFFIELLFKMVGALNYRACQVINSVMIAGTVPGILLIAHRLSKKMGTF
ncbi:MAG: hypothetical protein K6F84_00175, partial [Lachnospiraceae bacterium]|nr:hypothetical protein [Lachnospiraceae bacterium]